MDVVAWMDPNLTLQHSMVTCIYRMHCPMCPSAPHCDRSLRRSSMQLRAHANHEAPNMGWGLLRSGEVMKAVFNLCRYASTLASLKFLWMIPLDEIFFCDSVWFESHTGTDEVELGFISCHVSWILQSNCSADGWLRDFPWLMPHHTHSSNCHTIFFVL